MGLTSSQVRGLAYLRQKWVVPFDDVEPITAEDLIELGFAEIIDKPSSYKKLRITPLGIHEAKRQGLDYAAVRDVHLQPQRRIRYCPECGAFLDSEDD